MFFGRSIPFHHASETILIPSPCLYRVATQLRQFLVYMIASDQKHQKSFPLSGAIEIHRRTLQISLINSKARILSVLEPSNFDTILTLAFPTGTRWINKRSITPEAGSIYSHAGSREHRQQIPPTHHLLFCQAFLQFQPMNLLIWLWILVRTSFDFVFILLVSCPGLLPISRTYDYVGPGLIV